MIKVINPLSVGGIKLNSNTGSGRVQFLGSADVVDLQSLDRFTSETAIKKMIANNPEVVKIIRYFNPCANLNMEELEALLKGHSKETQNIALGILENLPISVQNKVNKKSLSDAAYLHDLGKVLIPKEVLNKPARLSTEEFKIMEKHSDLSYELLKKSGLNNETLHLIKNHHNSKPNIMQLLKPKVENTALEIISTADKYSALLESRVYKDALTPKEALTIIYNDVKKGHLDPKIFDALVNYANQATPEKALAS